MTRSAPPALGPPLVVLVVCCLVAAVGSAVARRLSNPVGKYRLLYVGALGPFALLSCGLLATLDLGLAVRTASSRDCRGRRARSSRSP